MARYRRAGACWQTGEKNRAISGLSTENVN
jgi:hypothetical protein